jgi:hypothetical protein
LQGAGGSAQGGSRRDVALIGLSTPVRVNLTCWWVIPSVDIDEPAFDLSGTSVHCQVPSDQINYPVRVFIDICSTLETRVEGPHLQQSHQVLLALWRQVGENSCSNPTAFQTAQREVLCRAMICERDDGGMVVALESNSAQLRRHRHPEVALDWNQMRRGQSLRLRT